MLWAPVIRALTMYLSESEYRFAMMRIMFGSTFSTVFLYLFCPGMLLLVDWRMVMRILGIIGFTVAAVFFILTPRFFKVEEGIVTMRSTIESKETGVYKPMPRFVLFPLIMLLFGILCQGILRDGVNTWTPVFLQDTFHIPAENAIFSTAILAVLGLFSFVIFDAINHKWLKHPPHGGIAGTDGRDRILHARRQYDAGV